MEKKLILNTLITVGEYDDFLKNILYLSKKKYSSYICISNVHMVMEAYRDSNFAKIVNDADIATPDGMPLAKSIKLLYGFSQDRVAGMDLIEDLIKICGNEKKSIFLYGSTDEILSKIVEKAKSEEPNLEIYKFSPPFRELTKEEEKEIIHMINEKKPDFVFVGLGCPKQEKWMAKHKNEIKSCMIGLGGAFDVYAGVKKRAPIWMQKNSLEWLYRLSQEPGRLWKRYFETNIPFLLLMGRQLFIQKLLKKI